MNGNFCGNYKDLVLLFYNNAQSYPQDNSASKKDIIKNLFIFNWLD
ncbi:hypothetical protein LLB_1918 [Legionella longbeachae D-4968]|nr:hypothetical protein LLB_1918 [Legionella longbeachae D-4968]